MTQSAQTTVFVDQHIFMYIYIYIYLYTLVLMKQNKVS